MKKRNVVQLYNDGGLGFFFASFFIIIIVFESGPCAYAMSRYIFFM